MSGLKLVNWRHGLRGPVLADILKSGFRAFSLARICKKMIITTTQPLDGEKSTTQLIPVTHGNSNQRKDQRSELVLQYADSRLTLPRINTTALFQLTPIKSAYPR